MVSGDTLILFLSKYVANFYHELHIFISYIWFLGLALLPNILSTSGREKKKQNSTSVERMKEVIKQIGKLAVTVD